MYIFGVMCVHAFDVLAVVDCQLKMAKGSIFWVLVRVLVLREKAWKFFLFLQGPAKWIWQYKMLFWLE